MQAIPRAEVIKRIQAENPWWQTNEIPSPNKEYSARPYLDLFIPLVKQTKVRRAVVLMGPRRVGKSVLIHHTIQNLIKSGIAAPQLGYLSVDNPLYNGLGLQQLLDFFLEASGADKAKQIFLFFDEVQYLRNWEVHLKVLVDSNASVKFIASGSAAAALKLKSNESGAGRFTDFLLPPLTFYEYLRLLKKDHLVTFDGANHEATDVAALNEEFVKYLNFGGYPEAIFAPQIQADPARFIKSDIVDKVLLRDLPTLYGIYEIQELNQLFTTLAYNTAQEVSLEKLSQGSGVAKNTLKKYIEYLEAAFLIKTIHRIDQNAKRFKRANFFKVYLTNPSIRSALFPPVMQDDEAAMGAMAETGIFSQWFHSDTPLFYARWEKLDGEVDIVHLDPRVQKPLWAVEVKWSDRFATRPEDLKGLFHFCNLNKVKDATVTSRTKQDRMQCFGVNLEVIPASLYCYLLGHNLLRYKKPTEAQI